MSTARSQVLRTLTDRIQAIEANWHPRRQAPLSLGIAALDELFPEGHLSAGSLVELYSGGEGAGTWTLALLMAKEICGAWKMLVIVDGQRCFYPPAAAKLGLDLQRSIVIRPRLRRDAFLATNQSLHCSAVGAVVGCYDQLRSLDARRLQLAAEAGGGVGFLLRPLGALRTPSFAGLRLLITPIASLDAARRLRVEVVRCRGGRSGQSLSLEVCHETGHVRLLPPMASATVPARATRASG